MYDVKNLLCRIGLHQWHCYIGTNFCNDPPYRNCLRCGKKVD